MHSRHISSMLPSLARRCYPVEFSKSNISQSSVAIRFGCKRISDKTVALLQLLLSVR